MTEDEYEQYEDDLDKEWLGGCTIGAVAGVVVTSFIWLLATIL